MRGPLKALAIGLLCAAATILGGCSSSAFMAYGVKKTIDKHHTEAETPNTTFHPSWLLYCGTNGAGSDECMLEGWTEYDLEVISERINTAIVYTPDLDKTGRQEHWEAWPVTYRGDCDDYAMTKWATLKGMGFPEDQMSLTHLNVYNDAGNLVGAHLYLVVGLNGKVLVLDSLRNSLDTDPYHIYPLDNPPYLQEIILMQEVDGRWVDPKQAR